MRFSLRREPFFMARTMLLLLIVSTACGVLRAEDTSSAQRPNVIMIPIDDLADYVSILQDHPGIHTPNFDRLAKNSVVFTRAFAAAPLCQPSRAAVSCGMFPHRTGIYTLKESLADSPVALEAVSLAEQFKRHGYDTFMTGKYYHGKPKNWWPADRIDAMWTEKMPPFSDHGPYLTQAEVIETKGIYAVGPAPGGMKSMPDVKSLAHMRQWLNEKHKNPFLIIQGINKPHLSFVAPQEFFELYPLDEIQVPETVEDDLADVPAASSKIFSRKDRLQFKRVRDYKDGLGWKMTMQGYLASISFCDWVLGQILDELGSSPYANNTIVVLWSDHGYHIGEKEKLHKQALWSQSCRVPFVIRLPNKTDSGSRCEAPVSLLDIYPTLRELCGLSKAVPQQLDGHSLVALLDDPDAEWPCVATTSHGPENAAVSDSRYRYIRYSDGSEELYDHQSDPREYQNVASDPEREAVKKRLAASLPAKWEVIK